MNKLLKFIYYFRITKIDLCILIFVIPIYWFLTSLLIPNAPLIELYLGWFIAKYLLDIIINYKEKKNKARLEKYKIDFEAAVKQFHENPFESPYPKVGFNKKLSSEDKQSTFKEWLLLGIIMRYV